MARARNIKPAFFKNADLVETSFETRLLFVGLWTMADREGRLQDRPRQIKMELFPGDAVDVDACLNALAQFDFIRRYVVGDKNVIQIVNFSKHQAPHGKEADSELPAENGTYIVHERNNSGLVTGNYTASTVPVPCKHRAGTVPARCLHPLIAESPLLNPVKKPISGDSNVGLAETKIDNVVKINSAKTQVPFQQIVDAYHAALPELPAVRLMTHARRKAIKSRWFEMLNSARDDGTLRYTDVESGVCWWAQYFNRVRSNPHWMGENDRGWTADIDWLLNSANFVKVLEYRPRASALSDKTGGLAYLASLAAATTTVNVKRYAEIVRESSIERRLIAASQDIASIIDGAGDVQGKVEAAQSAVMAVLDAQSHAEPKSLGDILSSALADVERRMESGDALSGESTGFVDLDAHLGGLNPGDLIVVAGQPGMGKTTLAVNIAENMASNGHSVLFVSLEMSDVQSGKRAFASLGGVSLDAINNCRLSSDDMTRLRAAVAKADRMKLYTDSSSRTVAQVATSARKIKRKHGLDLLVVDYIGLMQGTGETQALRIGSITNGLKRIAMDMGIPVIALSQLNRQIANREDHRPMMTDLKDSSSIEQDADAIIMVYQDEKYNPDTIYKGIAEAEIVKMRMGKTGRVFLRFDGERSRFCDANMSEVASIHRQEQAASSKSNRRFASL